jgi:hypothetical protein
MPVEFLTAEQRQQYGGFCISPRNGVLVSGGYAKKPISPYVLKQ